MIDMPKELHPDTAILVERFAQALAEKLYAAELKYGYRAGWRRNDWMDECRQHLREHVEKGDPRDVAAYCAFLWHHGESTNARAVDPTMVAVCCGRRECGGECGNEWQGMRAADPPQPAVKVPPEMIVHGPDDYTAIAWNACRAEVLRINAAPSQGGKV